MSQGTLGRYLQVFPPGWSDSSWKDLAVPCPEGQAQAAGVRSGELGARRREKLGAGGPLYPICIKSLTVPIQFSLY